MSDDFLPDLPDPEAILERAVSTAEQRLQHFTTIRDQADAEIEAARAVIDRLTGQAPQRGVGAPKPVNPATMRSILESIARHPQGCYASTVAADIGKGASTVLNAYRAAERDGLVKLESRRHGRKRATITDAGLEYLTAPAAPEGVTA